MHKKRVRLSFLVARTQKMLLIFSLSVIIFLGIFYLFLLTRVATKGYLLSLEIENSQKLDEELEQINTKIAQLETQKFITENTHAKSMVVQQQTQYLVFSPKYTAQK